MGLKETQNWSPVPTDMLYKVLIKFSLFIYIVTPSWLLLNPFYRSGQLRLRGLRQCSKDRVTQCWWWVSDPAFCPSWLGLNSENNAGGQALSFSFLWTSMPQNSTRNHVFRSLIHKIDDLSERFSSHQLPVGLQLGGGNLETPSPTSQCLDFDWLDIMQVTATVGDRWAYSISRSQTLHSSPLHQSALTFLQPLLPLRPQTCAYVGNTNCTWWGINNGRIRGTWSWEWGGVKRIESHEQIRSKDIG